MRDAADGRFLNNNDIGRKKDMNRTLWSNLLCTVASLLLDDSAMAADTIKDAHIDALSGPFALVGDSLSRLLQASMDDVNAKGGVLNGTKFELVNFDTKGSPQESVLILKQIIDSGIHFVSLGSGSHIAHAVIESINKHNSRNPDQAVLLLNLAAQDPLLTNEKCSFWHFRWEANTDMRERTHGFHRQTQRHADGLPDQPGLRLRPGHQPCRKGNARSEAPRHQSRGRRSAPARQGEGLRAVCFQDQGLGSGHGSDG